MRMASNGQASMHRLQRVQEESRYTNAPSTRLDARFLVVRMEMLPFGQAFSQRVQAVQLWSSFPSWGITTWPRKRSGNFRSPRFSGYSRVTTRLGRDTYRNVVPMPLNSEAASPRKRRRLGRLFPAFTGTPDAAGISSFISLPPSWYEKSEGDQGGSEQQVRQGNRQQELPFQRQQVIDAQARKGPAEPHVQENDQIGLGEEPD